jgi:hypothetical protein
MEIKTLSYFKLYNYENNDNEEADDEQVYLYNICFGRIEC